MIRVIKQSVLTVISITVLFLLSGCATREYPPDLTGELQPINNNASHKLLIEQQPTQTKSGINANPSIIK